MTDLYDIPMPELPRLEPARNRWGQYMLNAPDSGKKRAYVRVSTLKEQMQQTYGLDKWKMRTVAQGLAYEAQATDEQMGGRARILDRLVALVGQEGELEERDFNAALAKLAEEAFVVGGGTYAAQVGTAFHAWAEWGDLGLGTADDMPDMFAPWYRAYRAELAAYGITILVEYIERVVVNVAYDVAGTLDRVFQLHDGTLVLGDVKSGKDIRMGWLEIAQQLAAYQTAEYMLDDSDEWVEPPNVRTDIALVAHVPILAEPYVPTASLVPFDLAKGRSALTHSAGVYEWRKDREPGDFEIPSPGAELVALINAAGSAEELGALYEQHAQVWTDSHTMLGNRRLSKINK